MLPLQTRCVYPLLNRLPLRGLHQNFPGLLALLHLLRPISKNRLIAHRHTPRTYGDENEVAGGLNRTDQTPSGLESLESTRPQVQGLPIDEFWDSHAVLPHESGRTAVAVVALFHLFSVHPLLLLQGRIAPFFYGLLCHHLGCFPSRCVRFHLGPIGRPLQSHGFHLRSHLLRLLPKLLTLPRHSCAVSAAPARGTISCLRIRCCRTQSGCLRERRGAVECERAVMYIQFRK